MTLTITINHKSDAEDAIVLLCKAYDIKQRDIQHKLPQDDPRDVYSTDGYVNQLNRGF